MVGVGVRHGLAGLEAEQAGRDGLVGVLGDGQVIQERVRLELVHRRERPVEDLSLVLHRGHDGLLIVPVGPRV